MGPRILGPDRGPLEPGGPRIGIAPAIILKTIQAHKISTKKFETLTLCLLKKAAETYFVHVGLLYISICIKANLR